MLTVELFGKLPRGLSISEAKKLAEMAFKMGGGRRKSAMNISIVDDRQMRLLNRRHRGKDKVTDVLSFRYSESGKFPAPDEDRVEPLGDVAVCLPQVRRQAKTVGRPVAAEFSLMVVHGVLHLLGFDHETMAQETNMFRLQQDILIKAGIL